MTNDNPARQPEGTPAGGQFATDPRAEADISLQPAADPTYSVGISAVAELNTWGVKPLPQWPVGVPEPSTSYSWDDDGSLETRIDFGEDQFTIWGPTQSASDSISELPDEYGHLSSDVRDQLMAYGYQMHANLAALTGQLEYAVHTPAVRSTIESIAAGLGAPQPIDDPNDLAWRSPAQRSTARAEASLAAWFGGPVDESTLSDVLCDLLHYADAKGLKPTEFGAALHSAQRRQRDELERPEG